MDLHSTEFKSTRHPCLASLLISSPEWNQVRACALPLAVSSKLQILDISGSKIGPKYGNTLGALLERFCGIRQVDVQRLDLRLKGLSDSIKSLQSLPHLDSLDARQNGVEKDKVRHGSEDPCEMPSVFSAHTSAAFGTVHSAHTNLAIMALHYVLGVCIPNNVVLFVCLRCPQA